ncbi:hypothetical protein BD408DRAFT_486451 [Parasitella parasitica]|nr:hypothetical protein BD408DRAFT_486451 [Parasitella parasitica]
MVDNNENNLYLPFELRPDTDGTSKFIMNDKTVKNIIIHELLGSNISNNLYHSASTEWSDGTKSDVLYVPAEVNNDQPPILIEIQNSVDQAFMIRLIQYCTRVYERFQVLPVVLVFVVVKFSSKEFEQKFVPKVNTPYLLETACEFWAQEVNFISAKSIENHIKVGMNQLVALAYFTTCQSASLSLLEYAGDSTVRFLYSICKANMKKKGDGELVEIIDQSTEQIRKAIGLGEDPILTAEKCKGFAENLLETIEVQKRKLVEMYELNAEASQKQQKKYIAEDYKFIESSSEPGKRKKWKKIYDEGKAKGLFISYTSSNSLKSSYHHSKKREKN